MFLIYECEHCGKKGLKPFGKRYTAVWRIRPYWFCSTDCAIAEQERDAKMWLDSWAARRERNRCD